MSDTQTTGDDVFGFSPDGGKFVRRGNTYYWENGEITVIRPGSIDMICNVPMDLGSHENYADWSDEKRAELLAKLMTAQQERERVKAQADKKRSELVASARAKLTDEEIQAIYEDAAEYP